MILFVIIILVFRCSWVLFLFSDVPVFHCSCFQMFLFSSVPVSSCSCFHLFLFSLFLFPDVPVFHCSCFQMFLFSRCFCFPLSPFPVFLFLCSCFQIILVSIVAVFICSCFSVFLFLCSCCQNAEARSSRLCWLVLKRLNRGVTSGRRPGIVWFQSDIQVCTYHMRQDWNARDTKVSSLKTADIKR